MADLKKEVEAILFSAGRTVDVKELQKLLHVNEPGLIKETVRELKEEYESRDSPLLLLSEEDGWKLTVKERYLQTVQKINPHTELSKTILETLAVIAWKQPMLQSDVIKIRTNKAYEHIAELERLGFVMKQRHGRSYLLKITPKFMDYFDLPDDNAVKEMFKQFKDVKLAMLEKEKAGELETAKSEPSGADKDDVADSEVPVVEDDGVELKPYIDLPHVMPKPKTGHEVETYNITPEEIEREERMAEEEEREYEEEKGKEGSAEGEKEEEKESEGDKAKRLAEELLEEEKEEQKEAEEEDQERKLHPQLEEFIAGSMDQISPKKTEKRKETAEKKEEPEEGEDEEDKEDKEDSEDAAEADSGEDDDSGKQKDAEEFPGQFDGEDAEDQGQK